MRVERRSTAVGKKKNGGNGGEGGGGKANGKSAPLDERLGRIEQQLENVGKILKSHSIELRNIKTAIGHMRDRSDARFRRIEEHLGIGPPPEE